MLARHWGQGDEQVSTFSRGMGARELYPEGWKEKAQDLFSIRKQGGEPPASHFSMSCAPPYPHPTQKAPSSKEQVVSNQSRDWVDRIGYVPFLSEIYLRLRGVLLSALSPS